MEKPVKMQKVVFTKRFRPGLLSAVACAGSLWLAGCSKPAAAPPGAAMGPLPVSAVRVSPSEVPLTGAWVGTMDGYVNANIQPQVNGYLVRQLYREGSTVSKGQVLFEIDPRPFQASLAQAQGQIATSRAQIATAKLNLSFTQVRSLISGVAGQATTQVGNLVSPQSVLTAVSQLDPIKVYFSISDAEYLALVRRAQAGGADLLHSGAHLPLTLTLASGDVYPHTGRIVFVDRQINQQTGAIRIAAAFPNPGNVLRPGQFGRVSAQTEVLHNALLVPQIAVSELQGIEQVDTVGADGKVHVVNVKLGPQVGPNWVITSGLAPGAEVITDQLQKLKDGVPVQPHVAAVSTQPVASTTNDATGR